MNVEVNVDHAELVLRLACEIEDRTREEQRALADLAFRIDQKRNKLVSSNHRVGAVAEPSDLVGEFSFGLDPKREATRQRRLEAWPGLQ